MAFQMNATFLKVLREVLKDLFIMELNVKRGCIRKRRPRTKKVLSRSRFALTCHAQSIQKRERDRETKIERQRQRRNIEHITTGTNRKKRKGMYA